MKQIQKIINNIKAVQLISTKQAKLSDTSDYLRQKRQRYVATAPVGFKTRSGSDYFFQ